MPLAQFLQHELGQRGRFERDQDECRQIDQTGKVPEPVVLKMRVFPHGRAQKAHHNVGENGLLVFRKSSSSSSSSEGKAAVARGCAGTTTTEWTRNGRIVVVVMVL